MDSVSNDNAYAPPVTGPGSPAAPITGTGWAKFWGVLTLIGGVMLCLSIVGIILGIPYIIAGLAVIKGADETTNFNITREPEAADRALREFIRHFRIVGIVTVVTIGLYILAVLVFVLAGVAGMAES